MTDNKEHDYVLQNTNWLRSETNRLIETDLKMWGYVTEEVEELALQLFSKSEYQSIKTTVMRDNNITPQMRPVTEKKTEENNTRGNFGEPEQPRWKRW